MKLRLKVSPKFLLPARAPGDRRLWILGAIALRIEQGATRVWSLEVFWKRLAAMLAGIAVAIYLLAATALWAWLDRSPHNQVGWGDVALAPLQTQEFRAKRGETSIALGFAQLQASEFGEAFFNLRAGLARSPGNVRARIVVATMLAGSSPREALAVLEEGLVHTPENTELLRTIFGVYQQQQATERAAERAAELLARQPPLPPVARQLIGSVRAAALMEKGELAAADEVLAQLSPSGDAREDGRVIALRADVLARLGRGDEATALIERVPAGASAANLARVQAEIAIAAGDDAGLERALRRLRAAGATDPQVYLYGLQAWQRMKRLTLREMAEQTYLENFGNNDAALQLLAATGVALDLPELVQRTLDTAVANRLSSFAFRVHLTEIALRRGDFDAAFRQLLLWETQIETLAPGQRAYPQFIERLVRITVAGGEPQIAALETHLANFRGRVTAPMYGLAVRVLERADRLEAARSVARLGMQLYPYTEPLRAAHERLTEAVALAAAAKGVVAAGRPAVAAAVLPATAPAALAELDLRFSRDELASARELLRAIRSAAPPWAAAIERDLARREIQLALLALDPASARATLRAELGKFRSVEDMLMLVQLARELIGKDRVTAARLLRDELAAVGATDPEVTAALRELNLPDDLAAVVMTRAAALAALDAALEGEKPDEALRVLEYLRKQAPAWLTEARAELGVREVRLRLALDQRPLALAALKDLVVRTGLPRAAAFRLVRESHARGEQETALLLAREILKLLPGDPAATRLLKEAEAPPPASS